VRPLSAVTYCHSQSDQRISVPTTRPRRERTLWRGEKPKIQRLPDLRHAVVKLGKPYELRWHRDDAVRVLESEGLRRGERRRGYPTNAPAGAVERIDAAARARPTSRDERYRRPTDGRRVSRPIDGIDACHILSTLHCKSIVHAGHAAKIRRR